MPFVLPKDRCWMLKITVVDGGSEQRLLVEGKLMAPCVSELEQAWNQARRARRGSSIVVDLSWTTGIDPSGKAALVAMIGEGARLTAKGIYSKFLAEQLMTDAGASQRKHNKAISVDSNSAGSAEFPAPLPLKAFVAGRRRLPETPRPFLGKTKFRKTNRRVSKGGNVYSTPNQEQ
jgi:hypothetical protein